MSKRSHRKAYKKGFKHGKRHGRRKTKVSKNYTMPRGGIRL